MEHGGGWGWGWGWLIPISYGCLDTSFLWYKVERQPYTVCFGLSPLPGCNRHHQDDITFLVADPELNLHLLQLLGGGPRPKYVIDMIYPQVICHDVISSCHDMS